MYENISLFGPSQNIYLPYKPISIQSTKRNYTVDKTTAVSGFQRLVSFSVYQVSESIINKWGYYFLSGFEISSQFNNHSAPLISKHLETIFPVDFWQAMWSFAKLNPSIK